MRWLHAIAKPNRESAEVDNIDTAAELVVAALEVGDLEAADLADLGKPGLEALGVDGFLDNLLLRYGVFAFAVLTFLSDGEVFSTLSQTY